MPTVPTVTGANGDLEQKKGENDMKHGLHIITGPVGAGTRDLMAILVRSWDGDVVTIEDLRNPGPEFLHMLADARKAQVAIIGIVGNIGEIDSRAKAEWTTLYACWQPHPSIVMALVETRDGSRAPWLQQEPEIKAWRVDAHNVDETIANRIVSRLLKAGEIARDRKRTIKITPERDPAVRVHFGSKRLSTCERLGHEDWILTETRFEPEADTPHAVIVVWQCTDRACRAVKETRVSLYKPEHWQRESAWQAKNATEPI